MDEGKLERERHFWRGFFAGLIAALAVAGVIFCGYTGVFKELIYSTPEGEIVLSGRDTQRKLKEISDTINYLYLNDLDQEKVETWMYKGIMAGLEDPYADYYTAEELNSLLQASSGSYKGIGATLSENKTNGVITVVKCYEGTPAEESGLLPGDVILKFNGKDAADVGLTDMVREIKNGESDDVEFLIQRDGENDEKVVLITRREVDIPTVSHEMLDNHIGYIQISEFDRITTEQFLSSKEDLKSQGMEKLIIDLRNNPGGNLSTVVDMLKAILPEGLIVYTEDKYGNRTEYTGDGSDELDIPLVVLINGESASASEIFAGAVKDYGIGTLVGTTTFGKGIVQRVLDLKDGSGIKLTIAKYYTPKGNDIHEKGVEPDVEIELDEGLKQMITIPKEQDNQLQKALEILEEK